LSIHEYIVLGGDVNYWNAFHTTAEARAGSTDAAREILEDFVGAMDSRTERMWPNIGPPIHWHYARYIADALKKILAGADPSIALGIKIPVPGRRRGTTTHNDEALAAAFNLLLANGLRPKEAKLSLQEKTGATPRTIEKANKAHFAYRTFGQSAVSGEGSAGDREFALEVLKAGAQPYAAKIEAILAAKKKR
jgi:hypothetical protein